MQEYLTVFSDAFGEYTEKRSKFVSGVYHCESEEQAAEILAKVKSENFGANHNVYAYVLKNGLTRFSDDGEPHQTAGKPVFDVVSGSGIVDIIVVVTRYFGGVLLGTGGLVRAYSTAAKNALQNADVAKMCQGILYNITCEYTYHTKVVSVITEAGGKIENTEFADKVTVSFLMPEKFDAAFKDTLCETFSSRIVASEVKKDFFAFNL